VDVEGMMCLPDGIFVVDRQLCAEEVVTLLVDALVVGTFDFGGGVDGTPFAIPLDLVSLRFQEVKWRNSQIGVLYCRINSAFLKYAFSRFVFCSSVPFHGWPVGKPCPE